jgi:hypothetical protein
MNLIPIKSCKLGKYEKITKQVVDVKEDIKEYIKDNLKIEVEYNSPVGLGDGNIKVTLKLEGEIIDSDEKKIIKTFF